MLEHVDSGALPRRLEASSANGMTRAGRASDHNRLVAWEWVAPVTTGTVGVAGMLFTWLATKQNSDDAGATAKEARVQQRLENAYIELLDIGHRHQ